MIDWSIAEEAFWRTPAVEEVSAQEGFLLLVGPETGAQAWAEGGLNSMHRGFGEGSSPVTLKAFPVCFAQGADLPDSPVSLE